MLDLKLLEKILIKKTLIFLMELVKFKIFFMSLVKNGQRNRIKKSLVELTEKLNIVAKQL